jgi:hypothetical protein
MPKIQTPYVQTSDAHQKNAHVYFYNPSLTGYQDTKKSEPSPDKSQKPAASIVSQTPD